MPCLRSQFVRFTPAPLAAIFGRCLTRLASAALITGVIAGAAAPPALAMTRTEKTFDSWTVVCVENDDNTKHCSMLQSRLREQNKGLLLLWSIAANDAKDSKDLMQGVTVPAGVSIKEGIRLFIGDGDPLTLGYDLCGPRVCIARAPFTPELVATIKSSKKASASYVQASKQLVQVDLDLTGFSDAYDYLVAQLSS